MVISDGFYKLKINTEDIIPLMSITWLLVVLFVFHDGEEILYLPSWVERNQPVFNNLEARFPIIQRPLSMLRGSNQKQFAISVLVILLVLSLISGAAAFFPSTIWIQYVFISTTVIFTLHLFIHILQSVFIKKIVPGAITSLIVLPAAFYLWLNLLDTAKMTFGYSLFLGLIGTIFFLPVFPLILMFGNWAGRSTQSGSQS
jgi:hypothetical protein